MKQHGIGREKRTCALPRRFLGRGPLVPVAPPPTSPLPPAPTSLLTLSTSFLVLREPQTAPFPLHPSLFYTPTTRDGRGNPRRLPYSLRHLFHTPTRPLPSAIPPLRQSQHPRPCNTSHPPPCIVESRLSSARNRGRPFHRTRYRRQRHQYGRPSNIFDQRSGTNRGGIT